MTKAVPFLWTATAMIVAFDRSCRAWNVLPQSHENVPPAPPPTTTTTERSRRSLLRDLVSAVVSTTAATLVSPCSPATAAPPFADSNSVDTVAVLIEREWLRPRPPRLLRQNLQRDFAVLLMRSSYNALDEIDCVAMDQFQRDFFFVRQAEYEPYVKLLGGPGSVRQGDLTDPNYFDFISFAQYRTIARDLGDDPPSVFEERVPVEDSENGEFRTIVVRRDPSLGDDRALPDAHDRRVGAAVLDSVEETFGGTSSAIPPVDPDDPSTVSPALRQLANLFTVGGFCWSSRVEERTRRTTTTPPSSSEFEVVLTAPATLWSGACLKQRRSVATNDFFRKTARIMLERAGYELRASSVDYTTTEEITTLNVVAKRR